MIKYAVNVVLSVCLVLSSAVQASLITDSSLLTSDHYVTYESDEVTIDFAWVSPINVEFWGDPDLATTNQLFAPSLHSGWEYANDADLDILLTNFSLADFTNTDGSYKHAVEFWNSVFNDIVIRFTLNSIEYVDKSNLANYSNGLVSSHWVSSGENGQDAAGSQYETFYVRKTFNSSPTPVNEPTSLLILALALMLLSLRTRINY